MIIGIDVGNYLTKTSEYYSFFSKCSTLENRFQSVTCLRREGRKIFMEEGSFDTEYRKAKKENFLDFLYMAIAGSSYDSINQVVVGLPISQYKADKDEVKELILANRIQDIGIDGYDRKIIISDVEVTAEGVGAIIGTGYQGIIMDIGGRTTDIALIEDIHGEKKVNNPFSMPVGTLNLHTDFIKAINGMYGLDLKLSDSDRILKNGLQIDGEQKDISFALEVFKVYVWDIIKTLQLEYSIRTHQIMAIGGGAEFLFKPFKKRIPQIQLIEEPLYANALGYKRLGESLWL